MKVFAAIEVGSYELSMIIFEISVKNKMRKIDHIRHKINLGSETYATGKLSYEKVDELCKVLKEFKGIMAGYKVDAYRACGTSAVREMENRDIVLEQIAQKTGIHIEILSNSEQRFVNYKSIAAKGEEFNKMLEKGTIILDIGGGSIQVSLFDKGTLNTTQNLKLGVLRLKERLDHIHSSTSAREVLIEELDNAQLSVLYKLYLKDKEIENIILVDDYLNFFVNRMIGSDEGRYLPVERFKTYLDHFKEVSTAEIAQQMGMSEDNVTLIFISAILVNRIINLTGAKLIWVPGSNLCEGIAYEYAEKEKMVSGGHDFEKDILDCALQISKRYMGSRKRAETLESLTMAIFDGTKKMHGLGKRERLYLQIAAILHDCGKYISMVNLGECSYQIIMATEIIGLSHKEREMIANIVRFNHDDFKYFDVLSKESAIDRQEYLTIAKLTAILRIANGLDRSHKQKFKDVKVNLKDNELVLTVDTKEDISLEKGLFADRAEFFKEVFNVQPVIKQKRTLY